MKFTDTGPAEQELYSNVARIIHATRGNGHTVSLDGQVRRSDSMHRFKVQGSMFKVTGNGFADLRSAPASLEPGTSN
jgi:hypothetical protein